MDRTYYQALLRQVPPGALARAAVRRVSRAARKALVHPAPVSRAELIAAFGGGSEKTLSEVILAPRRGWSDVSRRDSVLRALRATEGAEGRASQRAALARQRTFDVFGHQFSFGAGHPIDWSLDVQSGQRYALVPCAQLSMHTPGLDPKFPWVFGRLDSLIALGQGYWLSEGANRTDFANEFVAQVTEFLDENPAGMGIHWTCIMEVGLRAINLAQALLMFRDAEPVRDPAWLVRLMRSLVEHARFIDANLEDGSAVPNNHLLADLLGLRVVGVLFPELPGPTRGGAALHLRLEEELLRQIHPDGCSFEGSTGYHRLVLEMAALAHLTGNAQGVPFVPALHQRLALMFRMVRAYCDEAGSAPQIGDNDSGRILPLRDRKSLDHGYLAPLGAALFSDRELKGASTEFPDEAAWLLGEEGRLRFEALSPTPDTFGFSSRRGGLHVLRCGNAVLRVSAGPSGQGGVGGHSHNDKLSFELHVGGVPVIVDAGTGTYSRDLSLRQKFRSTAAHNTVQVDGSEQSPLNPLRPFALMDAAHAELLSFCPGPERGWLTASHQGYAPIGVERTVVLQGAQGALSVEDWISGEGEHRVAFRLHLPDTRARLRKLTAEEHSRGHKIPRGPMQLSSMGVELGTEEHPHALILIPEGVEPTLQSTLYSPGYGEIREALAVVWESVRALPARESCVVLFLKNRGTGSPEGEVHRTEETQ